MCRPKPLVAAYYQFFHGAISAMRANLTLFNFEGAALPSIGIFQDPAAACERSAPGSVPCVVRG